MGRDSDEGYLGIFGLQKGYAAAARVLLPACLPACLRLSLYLLSS